MDSKSRRQLLTDTMLAKEQAGKNCYSCEGACCTYVMNSMQTTPLETKELYDYLKTENRITPELIEKLDETISWYRLDKPIPSDGKRQFARRTYTCPFLEPGAKGCTISRAAKPYGCLGFNPDIEGSIGEVGCSTDQDLLQSRYDEFAAYEDQMNAEIAQSMNLDWEKLPMPVALKHFIETLG